MPHQPKPFGSADMSSSSPKHRGGSLPKSRKTKSIKRRPRIQSHACNTKRGSDLGGGPGRGAHLLVQPEAVRLVRAVHDVLQVLPHELEQLLKHLLNLLLFVLAHLF